MAEFPAPATGMLVTYFIVSRDVARSRRFYTEVLGGEAVQWQTLELRWLATTRDCSDDAFKETLELLASEGERIRPKYMFIDSTEFLHQVGEGVLEWRDEHVIPRHNAAGVTRFAFLWPEGTPNTVESGAAPRVEGRASFPTAWFTTRDKAYAWLTDSAGTS